MEGLWRFVKGFFQIIISIVAMLIIWAMLYLSLNAMWDFVKSILNIIVDIFFSIVSRRLFGTILHWIIGVVIAIVIIEKVVTIFKKHNKN